MDDLYGNAWGESSNATVNDTAFGHPWVDTGTTAEEVPEEEDSSYSSPPPKPSEESGLSTKQSTLWVQPPNSDVWNSTSQQTPLSSSSPSPPSPLSPVPSLSHLTNERIQVNDDPLPVVAAPLSLPRPPSPDAFGSFEAGDQQNALPDIQDEGWGTSLSSYDIPATSASPWTTSIPPAKPIEIPQDDEWEAARRQKEQLDRKVPPEVLEDILTKFHEFAQERWPDPEQSPPDQDWMKGWRQGLDSVEGLETLVKTVLPDPQFSPRTPFPKTSIGKDMSKALRLSKHLPVTRISPMSHFLMTRGSSSNWEAAVKSRPDTVPDDMPVGWRLMEKQQDATPAVDHKAKKTSIFSFWGRRESSTATPTADTKLSLIPDSSTDASRSSTPPILAAETTVISNSVSQSPRNSVESRRSASTFNTIPIVPPAPSTSSLPSSDPVDFFVPEPAPSAVSRFLNRFSRPKNTSPRTSVAALSSEDLDFLSDSVPSATDNVDDDDVPLAQRKAAISFDPGAALHVVNPLNDGSKSQSSKTEEEFSAFFDPLMSYPSTTVTSTLKNTTEPKGASRPFSVAGVPSARTLNSNSASHTAGRASVPSDQDQNTLATFMLPPPPSSRSQTPRFTSAKMSPTDDKAAAPFLIPPPSSRSSSPAITVQLVQPPSTSTATLPLSPPSQRLLGSFDDEYSDFVSSGNRLPETPYTDRTPPVKDSHSWEAKDPFLTPSKSFDDFEGWSPTPPKPIEKSPPPPPPPVKPKELAKVSPSGSRSRRIPDHSSTLNLLQTAEARKGQWPAPASPSPAILDAPPMPAVRSNTSIAALLDDEPPLTSSTSHTSFVSPIGPSATGGGLNFMNFSKPSLKPHDSSQSLMDFGDFEATQVLKPKPVSNVVNGKSGGGGGLSAQDLSFFEGL